MTRTSARRGGLVAALLTGALALTACSDSTDAAGHDAMASSSPGAGQSADVSPGASFNDADVTFAHGMVPHHEQAIEMAQLAADRAEDPRVRDLATRIEAAQGPEIDTLNEWLQEWGAEDGMDHGGMGGMDHGGMMTEEDMQALMGSTGADFDRLFLAQMIVHHQGALAMAETEAAAGLDRDAVAMAEIIRDAQSAEIAEMEQLLGELGG